MTAPTGSVSLCGEGGFGADGKGLFREVRALGIAPCLPQPIKEVYASVRKRIGESAVADTYGAYNNFLPNHIYRLC